MQIRHIIAVLTAGLAASAALAGCEDGLPESGSDSAASQSDTPCCTLAKEKIVVEQNGVKHKIRPLSGPEAIAAFYNYGNPDAASSNTAANLEESDTSLLFFYADTTSCSLNMVMIHDKAQDGSGGQVVFDISGVPAASTLTVGDDPSELAGTVTPPTALMSWNWIACCTDGAAVDGFDGDFSTTITPAFNVGITTWKVLSQDKNGVTSETLALTSPVTLSKGGDDDSSSDDSSSGSSSSDSSSDSDSDSDSGSCDDDSTSGDSMSDDGSSDSDSDSDSDSGSGSGGSGSGGSGSGGLDVGESPGGI